jgi:predicted MFS family arabinose efflux permease
LADRRVLLALASLYVTQGIPFGLAAEYLPVVLRERGASLATIAAITWLQLPWQLKVLWADVADRPAIRLRSRSILLALQLALAAVVAAYAAFDVATDLRIWLGLTALAALVAASQDVFVDALAVRSLGPGDRGRGNVAQVAGYRLGILIGGAGLLVVVESIGARVALLSCAAIVASAAVFAFSLRTEAGASEPKARLGVATMIRHLVRAETAPVIIIAATYKLGLHVASVLIKPMCVDAQWTKREIGLAAVTLGTAFGLLGAVVGGLVHERVRETRALAFGAMAQTASIAPLILAALLGTPKVLTIAAIAAEHFASGLGTTVLFAALMSATRPTNAGLHYTILTSANALAIGIGGVLGGRVADRFGYAPAFVFAMVLCAMPFTQVRRWTRAAEASAGG